MNSGYLNLLREIYLDALRNREQKISKVRDSNFNLILKEAASRWIRYGPSPATCLTAGVDSSWNKRAYQGLNLYAIDAVAVSSSNDILASEYEDEIADSARNESLETKAMDMEAKVAQKAAATEKADMICIDGSIIARLNKTRSISAQESAKKYGSSIFVAKSSESRSQFASMGSRAGDIYYYSHASKTSPGFSRPEEIQTSYGRIFEVYARLSESTPMIRIEIPKSTDVENVKGLLDGLVYHSVGGYPYCLKLAHNACKISNEDIDRIASIFRLQNENGARDALNE
ncbi:MAG TPA: DNA double-strand break repair nuclease NurA [Nitrososphaera sp.]